MGAGAADYLLAKVEAAAPDIVVLPFGAYVCTVGTVAESVRARFGERPAHWFRETEGRIQAHTKEGNARRAMNLASRKAARRVLGARTLATVAQTASIYEEVLHRLARMSRYSGASLARVFASNPGFLVAPALPFVLEQLMRVWTHISLCGPRGALLGRRPPRVPHRGRWHTTNERTKKGDPGQDENGPSRGLFA